MAERRPERNVLHLDRGLGVDRKRPPSIAISADGRAVAGIEGGQIDFVRTDHIGRPVFATNDLGLKVWEASYLPFGGVHTSTGGIDLRFPGQWFQSESGLHQNWMRDYDPTTGRYIQADPLGLVDGASVYGYVLQNPGRYVDQKGLACQTVGVDRFGTPILKCDEKPFCPSGDCGFRPPSHNDPEFGQCVSECRSTLDQEVFAACITASDLLGRSGLPVVAICQAFATGYECRQRCDRDTGYCKPIADDDWMEFPHQYLTPQLGQQLPSYPGGYK